jgi:predicted nucleotidyltransferase
MQDERDLNEFIEAWRERLVRQENQKEQRTLRLRQAARDCARQLVQEFGASRVYLFGSLVEERFAHDRSDIDLAVEGLDAKLYWKALSALWALLSEGAELDLVPLERAWPSVVERVRSEGELLDALEREL